MKTILTELRTEIINIGTNTENKPLIRLVLNINIINTNIEVILKIVPNGFGRKILNMNAAIDKVITYINLLRFVVLMLSKVVNRHILTYTSIKHKKNPLMFINVSFGVLIAFHIV